MRKFSASHRFKHRLRRPFHAVRLHIRHSKSVQRFAHELCGKVSAVKAILAPLQCLDKRLRQLPIFFIIQRQFCTQAQGIAHMVNFHSYNPPLTNNRFLPNSKQRRLTKTHRSIYFLIGIARGGCLYSYVCVASILLFVVFSIRLVSLKF